MMMMMLNMLTLQDKFKTKLNDPAVAKALAAVELRAELAGKSGGQDLKAKIAEWRGKLEQDPKDLQTRYDLAHALFSTGQTEEALDHILDLVKRFVSHFGTLVSGFGFGLLGGGVRDKHWNDEAARKMMLKIFSVLGNNNELTNRARQRFASIWFC
jgi:putative thioredoxin